MPIVIMCMRITAPIMLVALPLALMGGCSSSCDTAPGGARLAHQSEAIALVWSTLGPASRTPPSITWMPPTHDCAPTMLAGGGSALSANLNGRCAFGLTYPEEWQTILIEQEAVGGVGPIGMSYLAHELLHAWLYAETGDADVAHAMPQWHDGGPLSRAQHALSTTGW